MKGNCPPEKRKSGAGWTLARRVARLRRGKVERGGRWQEELPA